MFKTQVYSWVFYFKYSGLENINFTPANDEIAAERVKSNPMLVASSGLNFSIGADDKKIYSRIPIPPNENTEKIDDRIKTRIIPK